MFKQHTEFSSFSIICFFCIKQCVALVDFYAPLFFSEVATIQPGEFCHKVNLCQNIAYIGLKVQDDSCEFCQDTVSTLLEKLKESDTKVNVVTIIISCFCYSNEVLHCEVKFYFICPDVRKLFL